MADDKNTTRGSDDSNGSDETDADYDETPTVSEDKKKRKSSNGFDEYTFVDPLLDDDEDAKRKAEEAAEFAGEKFLQMAKLKNVDYSKIDMVRMASATAGLNLDDNLVEPVPIPDDPEERSQAVKAIYGAEINPESEPFQDPVKSLDAPDEDDQERLRTPPNLYEALQSNFLKSNYKSNMYRLFLLGAHDENLTHLIEWNKEIVDLINVQTLTEPLNGVLCVYEYHYIHVLEGSEDNLQKLLQRYATDFDPSGFEWDLRFHLKSGKYHARDRQRFSTVQSWVLGIFKITERRFTAWRGEKVFPNKMHPQDIPPGGFREKYFHFLRQCMIMAFTYNRMAPGQFNPTPENNEQEFSPQMKKNIERAKIQRFKSLGKVVTPTTFIQYVIDHKDNPKLKIRSVREHLDLFGGTPAYISPTNTIWPAPGRTAPYD